MHNKKKSNSERGWDMNPKIKIEKNIGKKGLYDEW